MQIKTVFLFLIVVLCYSCAAPKVINQSGKVTPAGSVVVGGSYTANIPTKTIGLMANVVAQNVTNVANYDSIDFSKTFNNLNKAAIAQAIDPIANGTDFYIRVGVAKRFELGYKLAGDANTFNAQYQFLGPTGLIGEKQEKRMYGSVGLQYSWQSYRLPEFFGELQDRLGYQFSRNDFLLPVMFSYSFGNEEEYGALAFGAAASYSRISYSTLPDRIFDDNNRPVLRSDHTVGYTSFGAFVNVKAGYKYIYVVPALSMFYQNYGNYKLINGENFNFKGVTIIPSISLQLRLGKTGRKAKSRSYL